MTETSYSADELAELDSITRQIEIDAPAETVWALIVRPGWYVNEGTIDNPQDLRYETDDAGCEVAVLNHPTWGEFRFQTVELDQPRYAAFRWLSRVAPESTAGTLVEFWIEQRDHGVTLRVKESGFSTLSDDPAVWLKERAGNDKGWLEELALAKSYSEGNG